MRNAAGKSLAGPGGGVLPALEGVAHAVEPLGEGGAGTGEVCRVDNELGEIDRKSGGECFLHFRRLTWIDADCIAAARIDARLMKRVFDRHAVIDEK